MAVVAEEQTRHPSHLAPVLFVVVVSTCAASTATAGVSGWEIARLNLHVPVISGAGGYPRLFKKSLSKPIRYVMRAHRPRQDLYCACDSSYMHLTCHERHVRKR